ncbi:Lipopolysaccharide biosynthesis protein [Desulfonema limicola]|uniref:non-specific protein-tyrosine kinase n=1 Tax=Desulfonema limicola TaxID=45656 RepID=A0A975GFS0_9BACT|nr:polysaccharide biosynthesis tyrosine autokinase [Desulfonema limicola]QTA79469.1 Lipopolysaccharide biosynthesis protein [Desulfonema limicola]
MAQYDVDLRDYWRIIKKHKVLVFLMVFLVGCFSYIFAKMREPAPIFEAEAAVKIERRTNLAEFFMGGFWDQSDSLTTQAFIITSFPVLAKTAKYLGRIPENASEQDIRESGKYISEIKFLKSMIIAEQEKYTSILNIKTISAIPKEAADVANAVVVTYQAYNIHEKNKQTFETRAFIENQLELTGKNLTKAEESLRLFKEKNDILALEAQTSNILKRIFAVETELDAVKNKRFNAQSQLELINKADRSLKNIENIFLPESDNSSVQELNKNLRSLVLKRQTLLFDFTQEHPLVIEINGQIKALVSSIKQDLVSRISGLKARESDLSAKHIQLIQESKTFPEKALVLNRLQRELTLQESLYSQLKTKYQEILIQAAGKVEEVVIVRPATVPLFPTNIPSNMAVIATGIVMGLFMGIVFAFVAEALDTSIGTIEDVENLLKVPVLGMIPFVKRDECEIDDSSDMDRPCELVTHFDSGSLVSEAFRSIRTNLQFIGMEIQGKSFMVTSSFMQEGKTFNVVNIAVTFAQGGKKVLLIEADLRNPTIYKIFGLNQSPGLTDYVLGDYQTEEVIIKITDLMLGDMDIDDILMTPGLDNLSYVTNGSHVSNPSEILNSNRFKEFIETVYPDYDMIIIDAPPVLPVTDAVDIASLVDGVILIYTVGKIARGVLKRAKIALDHVNAKVLGVILNNVKSETGPEYFKYQSQYYYSPRKKIKPRKWGIMKRS